MLFFFLVFWLVFFMHMQLSVLLLIPYYEKGIIYEQEKVTHVNASYAV